MKPIKFISPEEYTKLYKASKDKRMRLFLMLGFLGGLRMSEIIGLPQRISICCKAPVKYQKKYDSNRRRNIKNYYCSKCITALDPKDIRYSGKDWEIEPLQPENVNLQTHQIKIVHAKGNKWRVITTPISLTEDYKRLLPLDIKRRTMQDRFAKLTLEVLGKKLSPHVLRHGFGNYALNIKGLSISEVQGLMGHSRIDITGIYTKANPVDAVNKMWKAMGGE